MLPIDFIALPKVSLHDHLDGGLSTQTLLDLGREVGLELPSASPLDLQHAIDQRANSGSLVGYLQAFGWTVAVMQTEAALQRVAREAVIDLADDGVTLAELRFAPLLHTEGGLSPQKVIDAVLAGLAEGTSLTGVPVGLILCALRHRDEAKTIVDLFEKNSAVNDMVIGIDLAGPEAGFPVESHPSIAAFAKRRQNAPITIHAGEAAGADSIWSALRSGAKRIGHGTRLIDDILGDRSLLRALRDNDILLEVCVKSNLQTGAVSSVDEHPLRDFLREGVKVSIDVDNRLVSSTRQSDELAQAHRSIGLDEFQLLEVAQWSTSASFMPGWAKARAMAAIYTSRERLFGLARTG